MMPVVCFRVKSRRDRFHESKHRPVFSRIFPNRFHFPYSLSRFELEESLRRKKQPAPPVRAVRSAPSGAHRLYVHRSPDLKTAVPVRPSTAGPPMPPVLEAEPFEEPPVVPFPVDSRIEAIEDWSGPPESERELRRSTCCCTGPACICPVLSFIAAL